MKGPVVKNGLSETPLKFTEEIYHSVILLTSTIGFPKTSAAMSWVYDILGEEKG